MSTNTTEYAILTTFLVFLTIVILIHILMMVVILIYDVVFGIRVDIFDKFLITFDEDEDEENKINYSLLP